MHSSGDEYIIVIIIGAINLNIQTLESVVPELDPILEIRIDINDDHHYDPYDSNTMDIVRTIGRW